MACVPRKKLKSDCTVWVKSLLSEESCLCLDHAFCAPSQYSKGTGQISRLYISIFAWHNCPLECLLLSSLPGKASRTLVESQGLQSNSTRALEAEPGKLDIKRSVPGVLFISLPIGSLFKLAFMTFSSIFVLIQRHWRCHSKVQPHHDLIKTHAMR